MPFIVGFRLLVVCLFSYNPSSYLSLCDCKATMLCYNNGLGRDDKRRTVDSFVVNKPSFSLETE